MVGFVPKAELYLGYFSTSPVKAPLRTLESTLVPIMSTAPEISWFGRGLGEMAPGRQHVGGESLMYAEGGLVRVFVETGWIGLAAFVVIVLTFLARCLSPFQVNSSPHRMEQGTSVVVLRAGATAALLASLSCLSDRASGVWGSGGHIRDRLRAGDCIAVPKAWRAGMSIP